jgi:Uma2 family endonuclease
VSMATTPTLSLTLRDLADWDADHLATLPDDGNRYELINGQLHVSAAPLPLHQRAVRRLLRRLEDAAPFSLEVFPAPTAWRIDARTQLEPDLLVTGAELVGSGSAHLERPPVLVVEILSPSTRAYDLGTKLLTYSDAGLDAYWIIDPDQPAITEHRRVGERLVPVATVSGSDTFTTDRPYPVSFSPIDLVA